MPGSDNAGVSIGQVAAQSVAVVAAAWAVFGSSPQSLAPGEPSLESGAQIVRAAGARAAVVSGDLIDEHHGFVNDPTIRADRGHALSRRRPGCSGVAGDAVPGDTWAATFVSHSKHCPHISAVFLIRVANPARSISAC